MSQPGVKGKVSHFIPRLKPRCSIFQIIHKKRCYRSKDNIFQGIMDRTQRIHSLVITLFGYRHETVEPAADVFNDSGLMPFCTHKRFSPSIFAPGGRKAMPQSPPPAPEGFPAPPYCSARSHNVRKSGVSIAWSPTSINACRFFFTPAINSDMLFVLTPCKNILTARSLFSKNASNLHESEA